MKSFEEIAEQLTEPGDPMSRQRVQQIHDRALKKLRITLNLPENRDIRNDFAEILGDGGTAATYCRIIVTEREEDE